VVAGGTTHDLPQLTLRNYSNLSWLSAKAVSFGCGPKLRLPLAACRQGTVGTRPSVTQAPAQHQTGVGYHENENLRRLPTSPNLRRPPVFPSGYVNPDCVNTALDLGVVLTSSRGLRSGAFTSSRLAGGVHGRGPTGLVTLSHSLEARSIGTLATTLQHDPPCATQDNCRTLTDP